MLTVQGHRRLCVISAPLALFTILTSLLASGAVGQETQRQLEARDLKPLTWRSIGPANMAGRVACLALAPSDDKTIYIGYATGGLWRSTNRGTTFTPVFDTYETSSIGSVAVCDAPSDWPGWSEEETEEDADLEAMGRSKIVWLGTGEGNGRNSSSWGNGVYRSTDGGETFAHLGLADAHDIPALAVDPRDPDVCYVAALGHLWGANDMRGVYRTSDGGKTWSLSLHIDENTGAVDVLVDPSRPDTVFAAMYMRRRTPGTFQSGGPEGGIYRSTDNGASWTKLTDGLPEQTGRIGLSICGDKPDVLCAVVESDEGGWSGNTWSDQQRAGGVFRSEDGGDTWQRVTNFNPRSFYFSKIKIDPHDDQRVYLLGWQVAVSDDGGRTFRNGLAKVPHVDFHAMVVNPDDTDHLLAGSDGGLYISYDQGETWDFHNHMAVGQFYNIAVDDSDPYRVGGGLQDNGTWFGPSENIFDEDGAFMGRAGGITNHDWIFVWGGDGFHLAFDPNDPEVVYAESQGGYLTRIHLDTGIHRNLRPEPKEGEPRFRFNWNAPFFISPHDPATLYLGGNYVFKFTERGDRWERISDDLSTANLDQIVAVGSEAETAGTVVSLAESPIAQGMLWAGSDDGLIHLTTDDGESWTDVTPDAVDGRYISRIEPSHHDQNRAFVSVDGHRTDSFEPVLLMTNDTGNSWSSIEGNLPRQAPIEVVREDPRNADVLYVGTEHAAYVTIDRGERWIKLNGETLPTVAVDDLKIQHRENDLVAGTHGRSIYILDDISPVSQMTDDVVQSAFHVFEPMPAKPRYRLTYGDLWSDKLFIAQNPPVGAMLHYWIREYDDEDVSISITNEQDVVVRTLEGTNRPGLNRVVWDLLPEPDQLLGEDDDGLTQFVPAGEYTVTITSGDQSASTTLAVLSPPGAE